jgi:hypothetical protein
MRPKRRVFSYLIMALAMAAIYAFWAPKGISRLSSNSCIVQVSPKGTYRVDICTPSLPYISFSKEMPRFVRFYDQRTQQMLGESDILDMDGRGEVFWPHQERLSILVGGGDGSPEMAVKDVDGQ